MRSCLALAVVLGVASAFADDVFYIRGKEGTCYASFTLARAAAKAGDTLVLMRDYDANTDGGITFSYKNNLTLDLGGHTLSADKVSAISVQTGYTGTITNGTVDCGTGSARTAVGGRNGAIAIFDGTLNIQCTVTSGRSGTSLCDCMGTVTVNVTGGADVSCAAGAFWTKYFDSNPNLTVNVSGGAISTTSDFYGLVYVHTSDVTVTVNVTGGEVSSGKRLVYVYYDTYTGETTVNTIVNATFTGGTIDAAENVTFDPDHAVENVNVTSMTAANCLAKFKSTDHFNVASGSKVVKIGDWYRVVDESYVTEVSTNSFVGAATTASTYTSMGDMLTIASNWSDGEEVSRDDVYTINKAFSVADGLTFNGKALILNSGATLYFAKAGATVTFANEGLVFNGGTFVNGNGKDTQKNWKVIGNVTFRASTYLQSHRNSCAQTFLGPKISAAAGITVGLTAVGSVRKSKISDQSWHQRLLGDMSEFYGTLEVGGADGTWCFPNYALVGSDNFAGTVKVMGAPGTTTELGNGVFGPCSTNAAGNVLEHVGETKVAKLTVNSNGCLAFSGGDTDRQNYGTITVTEKFTAKGKVNLFVVSVPAYATEAYRVPLLKTPLGSDLDAVNFVLRWYDGVRSLNGVAALSVEKTETQEILYLNYEKYSLHTSAAEDASSNSSTASKFYTYWQWPDQTTKDYQSDVAYVSGAQIVYGGTAISLSHARKLSLTGNNLFFSSTLDSPLVELYGATLRMYNNLNLSVTSDIKVVGSGGIMTQQASSYAGKTLTYTGTWTGDGAFTFSGGGIYHALKNDMSAFEGRVIVGGNSEAYHATVRIRDATSFGRPAEGSSFSYNALTFSTKGTVLVTNTIATASDRRGIYFTVAGGTVDVAADKVFTYAGALTLAGVMRKAGAGTYVQGGELAFLSTRSATPLANTNVVSVLAGAIGVRHADAFNGAAITLADGASLGVDVAATNADVIAYGLRNTKWATPLVTEAASGKVGVSLYAGEAKVARQANRTIAVCTLATSVAEGLSFEQVGARRVGGYTLDSFATRDNGDGTTTVLANLTGLRGGCFFLK